MEFGNVQNIDQHFQADSQKRWQGTRKAQSRSLAGVMRHRGYHENDGGVPLPLLFARFCKRWGGARTMSDFMEALASDKYENASEEKRSDGGILTNQKWNVS